MALPTDRNSLEFLAFDLGNDGLPVLKIKAIAGGAGSLDDLTTLNDRWFQAFRDDGSGNPILGVTFVDSGVLSLNSLTGALNIVGTANRINVSAAGSSVTLTLPDTVSGLTNVSAVQLTSTIATGTAPFVVASTTAVANLNASLLNGATFAAPGAIGGTTPGAATFTTATINTRTGTPAAFACFDSTGKLVESAVACL